ncbi:MAG TPA: glycosyltransferase, partial [Fimbriimonadaceae bacterium]|nr:glycosyltransferase [Fimbriimonadaceae bacterium]
MRVIVVSDSARISGGAEKVALTSAIALARAGVKVHAFCGTGPKDDRLEGVENLDVTVTGHLPFYENPNRLQGIRQILWNSDARHEFGQLLSKHDSSDTVVHFHCYLRVHSASVLDVALDLGFPVVVTLHDYGLACPNMGFYNYRTREVCALNPMSVECVRTQCTVKGRLNKLGFVARGAILQTAVRWNRRIRHFVAVSGISGEIMRPFL